MQLSRFTDYGLRVLMYLCAPERDHSSTVAEIAERFEISRHHLNKVVQFLARQGWVVTCRGKGGGLSLAHCPKHYKLGNLIRLLEGNTSLVDCAAPVCALHRHCGLKPLLDEALAVFYEKLDAYTLADVHTPPTQAVILQLQRRSTSA